LASAAAVAGEDPSVERVFILTPDKDLAQCVRDKRVLQMDRRKQTVIDANGVVERFGVLPESIPDYLGLVGDSADGFPGLPQWGAKSAAAVLRRYPHLEDIPEFAPRWDVTVRSANKLNATLRERWEEALLFRDIATLRIDREAVGSVESWRWRGPTAAFAGFAERIDSSALTERAGQLAARLAP
jgi:5'-3' exonuclease